MKKRILTAVLAIALIFTLPVAAVRRNQSLKRQRRKRNRKHPAKKT